MLRLSEIPADVPALRRSLTETARNMQGSLILQIAGEVRALAASGRPVCNLTVGDFDARQFPIPDLLRDATFSAINAGHTNYPPSEGIPELRRAIVAWYKRHLGVDVPVDWIVVASGARPVMYATFRLFLEPGDELLFAVPSWNNGYYAQLCQAVPRAYVSRAEDGFFPTAEGLREPLRTAQVLSLNSPLNPTGTAISAAQLTGIAEAVVAENNRRLAEGRRPVVWMWDQVYWRLCYGEVQHRHPATLVPEVAPYVVTVDAISKAFAATGLRVGWAMLHPALAERMKALVGHVGAWAPRPEQMATATLLDDDAAQAAYGERFKAALYARLSRIATGLDQLGVEHLDPAGAMYLSARFDLFGQPGVDGQPMRTNEDIRKWLLASAGLAVVPFQAFDLPPDSGWFRLSVGAVSLEDLDRLFERLPAALR